MKIEIDLQIKDIKIGQLLKIRRQTLKLTQLDMAKKLKVCNASIEHKEAGTRGIDLDFLEKWCEILGLKLIFDIKEVK